MLRVLLFLVAGALAAVSAQPGSGNTTKPHIIFIVADDLGWNDVGWHNPDVKTPVLDQLAHDGVILNQTYVNYVCTPSRTAFMTGYFPYHVGMQHGAMLPEQPAGVPSKFTFLPEKLKELGYSTHVVGKWHLGFCNWNYTPTYRGFDSFYGFYNGQDDYYKHTVLGGLDLRDDKEVVKTKDGEYSTYFFTDRIVDIIEKNPLGLPLFLYLPFQNVHEPLQVPKRFEDMYSNVQNENRRIFLGMVSAMDEAIGNVTMAMKKAGLWDNTLLIFTADNGGWPLFSGNNFPLRGGKITLWEGGTRASAFVHGKMLQKTGYTSDEMIHAVDWFPTILAAAGGTADPGMDGVSQLDTLVSGQPSPRTEFVYNIDDDFPTKQGAIRVGDYKLIEGYAGKPDGWIRPDNLTDSQPDSGDPITGTWLFNLKDDPTEHHNLADTMPDKLKEMQGKLEDYRMTIVPAIWPKNDPKGNPKHWDGAWSPGWC
ncbi:ARSB [Branchiostoma lanceolatum]|uniref:ARSB protein n=1 Tax=Branchiostoma lanceolatum TaxID=7740 RepID=A0A8K0F3P4_BRALA|nr:ARSB [Branchiostoma lanceolatum]